MEFWDDSARPVLCMNMDGGRPCLDLLNTLRPADIATPPKSGKARDLLSNYLDFVALAVRTAILPAEEADVLSLLSSRNPESALESLGEARSFRTFLRNLVLKATRGAEPSPGELAAFEERRALARSLEMFVWEDGRFKLRPRYQAEGLSAPLHAFVRDVDTLLRSPDLMRIRVLKSHSPDALFILDKEPSALSIRGDSNLWN